MPGRCSVGLPDIESREVLACPYVEAVDFLASDGDKPGVPYTSFSYRLTSPVSGFQYSRRPLIDLLKTLPLAKRMQSM